MKNRTARRVFTGLLCCVLTTNAADIELEKRVDELVAQMTLQEKLDMIHGDGFNISPVNRLGINAVNMSDASMGLRVTPWPAAKGFEYSTAFPASILLAATWNPDQAGVYATAVAEEFKARSMHVLLGPGVNIYRHPFCGRNYEYMGEDPFLASRMVVPYINAVSDVGVISTIKHFVANNSENERKSSNTVVSERALREIYFPAFEAAVKEAQVPAVMNAYNLVNGEYCGESSWLLKQVLREEWGFDGMVISDWKSIWNSDLSANSGVDIEMPGAQQTDVLIPETMKKLLAEGKTTEAEIDSKVKNMVRPCLRLGVYENDFTDPSLNKREEHALVALETAREGMVLLKNSEQALPLNPQGANVVVIGPTAAATPTTGGGSGGVTPENPVSIWNGIKPLFPGAELLEAFDADRVNAADAVVICVGLNTTLDLDPPNPKDKRDIAAEQAAFNERRNKVEGEGRDRGFYGLPEDQEALIQQCAAAGKKTIVLLTAGSGVGMPWIDQVDAVLHMFYPGANGSIAAAEIVAGKVNPSGKLPISIEKRAEDNASHGNHTLRWGSPKKSNQFAGIEPQFCFGHGLSYTSFEYSGLTVEEDDDHMVVSLTVTNSGSRDGKEVVQVYVHDAKSSVPRPPQELKGFKKVHLKAGESKKVSVVLNPRAFSFWDPETKRWMLEPGQFEIRVYASSRDIRGSPASSQARLIMFCI